MIKLDQNEIRSVKFSVGESILLSLFKIVGESLLHTKTTEMLSVIKKKNKFHNIALVVQSDVLNSVFCFCFMCDCLWGSSEYYINLLKHRSIHREQRTETES